ncbi:MAG: hypothetical protein ACOYL5_13515 [Phototrophicaceae bacterium]
MNRRAYQIISGAIVILSLALAVALAFDLNPYLRGGFGWRWGYVLPPVLPTVTLIAVVTVYVAGAWQVLRRTRHPLWALLWALVGSIAIPLCVVWQWRGDVLTALFNATVSLIATGPHHAAYALDINADLLRHWATLADGFTPKGEYHYISRHVVISPPGLPLLYEGLNTLLGFFPQVAERLQIALIAYQCRNYALLLYSPAELASAAFGMGMPLYAALTVFPLYGLARRLNLPAREAVLWWALVPALASFVGSWNTVYPLIGTWALWLFVTGLDRADGRWQWLWAGIVFGGLLFLNFAPIPLGLMFGFYTLLYWWRYERAHMSFWRPISVGLWFAFGIGIVWGGWMLWGGESPVTLIRAAFDIHLELERAYAPWLFYHTYDWLIFAGIPLALVSIVLAFRRRQMGSEWALALWLSVAVIVLSGTARAETSRVWTVFTPLLVIAAAAGITTVGDGARRYTWLMVTVAQAALLVVVCSTWDVFGTADAVPNPPVPTLTSVSQPADATFGGQFRLIGWEAIQEGNVLRLTLNWQPLQPTATAYWFGALLVYPDGTTPSPTWVWQPQETNYPTSCWLPGTTFSDEVMIPLPQGAPAGDYWVSLNAFINDGGSPEDILPVTLPSGERATQVGLGAVALAR